MLLVARLENLPPAAGTAGIKPIDVVPAGYGVAAWTAAPSADTTVEPTTKTKRGCDVAEPGEELACMTRTTAQSERIGVSAVEGAFSIIGWAFREQSVSRPRDRCPCRGRRAHSRAVGTVSCRADQVWTVLLQTPDRRRLAVQRRTTTPAVLAGEPDARDPGDRRRRHPGRLLGSRSPTTPSTTPTSPGGSRYQKRRSSTTEHNCGFASSRSPPPRQLRTPSSRRCRCCRRPRWKMLSALRPSTRRGTSLGEVFERGSRTVPGHGGGAAGREPGLVAREHVAAGDDRRVCQRARPPRPGNESVLRWPPPGPCPRRPWPNGSGSPASRP